MGVERYPRICLALPQFSKEDSTDGIFLPSLYNGASPPILWETYPAIALYWLSFIPLLSVGLFVPWQSQWLREGFRPFLSVLCRRSPISTRSIAERRQTRFHW